MRALGGSKGRLAAVAAVAGVALVVGVVAGAFGGHDRTVSSTEARLAQCANQGNAERTRCFQRVFTERAADGRVPETLGALQSLVKQGVLDDCHLEGHALAHAAFAVFQSVEKVFLLGDSRCRMGYLHGAVEASVLGVHSRAGQLHAVRTPPCSRFRTIELHLACSHGFGHALMLFNGGRIGASVRGCAKAASVGTGVAACQAGVMMQNSVRFSRRPPDEFRARAAAACARVASAALRESCFDNLGQVAALVLGHDSRRSVTFCRPLGPRTARAACLRGVRGELKESVRERGS